MLEVSDKRARMNLKDVESQYSVQLHLQARQINLKNVSKHGIHSVCRIN